MPLPVILSISANSLIAAAAVILPTGFSLDYLAEEFREQANEAYNDLFPDRANDTAVQQANDMNRDAFRHA